MKREFIAAALLTLGATGATSALAQTTLSAGDLSFAIGTVSGSPVTDVTALAGRGLIEFGAVDLQLDVAFGSSVTGALSTSSAQFGAHLSYRVSDSLRLGAFAMTRTENSSAPSSVTYTGIGGEAMVQFANLTGQAYLENSSDNVGGTDTTLSGIRVDYRFDQGFGLFAAYDYIDYNSIMVPNVGVTTLGGSYRLPGMPLDITASASRNNFGLTSYALGVSYALGAGNDGLFAIRP